MNRRFLVDLVERMVWTFIEAFLAYVVVMEAADWNTLRAALVAAAFAVAKALVATQIGKPDSASTANI